MKYILLVLGLAGCLRLADTASLASTTPDTAGWVMLATEMVAAGTFSLLVGYYVGRSCRYALALGPLLYYGLVALSLHDARHLYLDLRLPLTLLVSVASGLVGGVMRLAVTVARSQPRNSSDQKTP